MGVRQAPRRCLTHQAREPEPALPTRRARMRPLSQFSHRRTRIFVTEVIQTSVSSNIFRGARGFEFRGFSSEVWIRELGIGSLKA
jgi:hypothetical protein